MACWSSAVGVFLAGSAGIGLFGCDSGCDQKTIDRAVAFRNAHQSCATDDDCIVISDFCEELPGGYCGQLAINREGYESAEWKTLESRLEDCAPSSCSVCGAALLATCISGRCDPD
jgi:hypothetical protein